MWPKVMDVLLLLQKLKLIWWSQSILHSCKTSQCKPEYCSEEDPCVKDVFGFNSPALTYSPTSASHFFQLLCYFCFLEGIIFLLTSLTQQQFVPPRCSQWVFAGVLWSCNAGRMWKAKRGVSSRNPHRRGLKRSVEMIMSGRGRGAIFLQLEK